MVGASLIHPITVNSAVLWTAKAVRLTHCLLSDSGKISHGS